ncbi:MAG: oxygen-independent coproporphyrinogen III oxidase [Pseudomonadota bacterium]
MAQTNLNDLTRLISEIPATGPRYTSYPTANLFYETGFESAYAKAWDEDSGDPISVYLHVPFCSTVCFYCACNKVHTANPVHAKNYTEHVKREIDLQAAVTDRRGVSQLHFGGGTPTTLDHGQMAEIFAALKAHYVLDSSAERDFSIELDPRKTYPSRVEQLASLGFNRISVGVQDFEPEVQHAINRVQSEQQTAEVLSAARAAGMQSTSVDLIYGLPKQTSAGFYRTIERTLRLDPDRISLYNYAHLPELFKIQRQIRSKELPEAETKLTLLRTAIEQFESAGYVYLGMDHFAKRSDSLVIAGNSGTLQRNFMGYSTHADCDLLALGVSAIGAAGSLYTQNHKTLNDYYGAIDSGRLPLAKGLVMTDDDRVRRYVIQSLMCRMALCKHDFEDRFGLSFDAYFAAEAKELQRHEAQGLLRLAEDRIEVTDIGRFFIRNICMTFDAYLKQSEARFSKTI